MLTEDQIRVRSEAEAIAQAINVRYGGELLIVAPPPREELTDEAVRIAVARLPRGWASTRTIFFDIRKRPPTHGEAVALGRKLGRLGFDSRVIGAAGKQWLVGL